MQRRRNAYVSRMADQQHQDPAFAAPCSTTTTSSLGNASQLLAMPFSYPQASPPSPSSAHAYLFADPATQDTSAWANSTPVTESPNSTTQQQLEFGTPETEAFGGLPTFNHSLTGSSNAAVAPAGVSTEGGFVSVEDTKLLHEVLQIHPASPPYPFSYQQSFRDPTQQSSVDTMSAIYTPAFGKMGIYMSPDSLAQIRNATMIGFSPPSSTAGMSPTRSNTSTVSAGAGGDGSYAHMMATSASSMLKKKPASRICRVPGCNKGIRSRGLCKGHGGGRRCQTPGCEISDQGGGHCIAHGGGKRCHVPGCVKSAQSKGLCKLHGGARRCKVANCAKNCQVKGLCRLHYGMLASVSVPSPSSPYECFGSPSA